MAWIKYKEIRYALPGIPGANLSGFPKLVTLHDADILAELSSGGGIKFTSADGLTDLPFGLYPGYDPHLGDVYARVQLDLLTAASVGDVLCRLYYSAGEASTEDKAGTVSNGYALFLPLEEDPGGSPPQAVDWTSENNDLSASGLVTGDSVAGQVGNAVSFAGNPNSQYQNGGGATGLSTGMADPWTFTLWHRTFSLVSLSHYFGFGGSPISPPAAKAHRGLLCFGGHYYFWGSAADWDTGIAFDADGDWHHAAFTSDGVFLRLYVDGVLVAGPQAIPYIPGTAGTTITVGSHHPAGASPDAVIDEPSISSVARSAEWLAYVYADEADNPATFTLSAEQGGGGSDATVTVNSTATTWAIPTATVTGNGRTTVAPVSVMWSVPIPVETGGAIYSPSVVAVNWASPSVSLLAAANVNALASLSTWIAPNASGLRGDAIAHAQVTAATWIVGEVPPVHPGANIPGIFWGRPDPGCIFWSRPTNALAWSRRNG